MQTREFVEACKRERDRSLALYSDPDGGTAAGRCLKAAKLDARQRKEVIAAIDNILTDTFYTMLLALAGAASLGGVQQEYHLADETGRTISPSKTADLESLSYEIFQKG